MIEKRKYGMILNFFDGLSLRDRLEIFKKTGFDNVILSTDKRAEKYFGNFDNVVSLCREYGIGISQIHAAYKQPDVDNFWKDNAMGEAYEQNYLEELENAHKHNVDTVVFHLNCSKEVELTKTGLSRIKKMVKLAEKLGVKIAIENLYKKDELDYIFKNVKSDYLGMCYDCGHRNFLTPEVDFLSKFGSQLFAVHLHDNDGLDDLHQIPFTNKIDWNSVAKGLANSRKVSLDGEVKMSVPSDRQVTKKEYRDFMRDCHKGLEKLNELIKKYEKNI